MRKVRQPIPVGLADIPAGPELAVALAGIDLSRLSGSDCVEVLQAQHRQAAHEQAQLMAAMVEVALCDIGPDDRLPRMTEPDEFSADEIRAALSWTRRAADTQLSLAWDVLHRLPPVFAALDAGNIDVPKAKVFSEWTYGLTDAQAQEVCGQLLPAAPALTTGQLADRIKKMAIALDPGWARRRYEEAVRDRRVVGYRNDDGSANVSGQNLPTDRAAAACAHIDAIARKAKQAGDCRPMDCIRADLYLGMLDGTYTGWSDTDIIGDLTTTAARATRHDASGDEDCASNAATGDEHCATADSRDRDARLSSAQPAHRPSRSEGDAGVTRRSESAAGVSRRAGVEIRVEVTTLLGRDDHPAELAGWGPVHADVARRLVRDQTAAEWRYAITDDDGRLWCEGITRRRPGGFPSRRESAAQGGIVELQVKWSVLRRLAAQPTGHGPWTSIVADLALHAEQHGYEVSGGGRRPGAPLRRRTEIRDRTCTYPGCRVPASGTDGDHTDDWAHGGATSEGNIDSLCRHDHRLKHEGGWRLIQPRPGELLWRSRLGRIYRVQAPLIIEPLPDPIPRDPPPDGPYDHDDAPIWREPPRPPAVPEPPALDADEPIPF